MDDSNPSISLPKFKIPLIKIKYYVYFFQMFLVLLRWATSLYSKQRKAKWNYFVFEEM